MQGAYTVYIGVGSFLSVLSLIRSWRLQWWAGALLDNGKLCHTIKASLRANTSTQRNTTE